MNHTYTPKEMECEELSFIDHQIFLFLFNEFIKVGAACISMHIMAAH
jgi:hypothetical protein